MNILLIIIAAIPGLLIIWIKISEVTTREITKKIIKFEKTLECEQKYEQKHPCGGPSFLLFSSEIVNSLQKKHFHTFISSTILFF